MNIGDVKLSSIFAKGLVVSVLLLSMSAVLPLLQLGGLEEDYSRDDPVIQFTWLGVYAVAFLLFIVHGKQCLRVATRDKLLLLLLGIALISILWSAEPEATLRRGIALIGTTLFGIYLATRYNWDELLRLLAWSLGIAALLSLVFALALPSYGIQTDEFRGTAWRGIFTHKNMLGRIMVLGAVVFLLLALSGRKYRWIAWAGLSLSVVLLLLSESIAAAATLVALLVLLPLYRALRWHQSIAVPFFILVVLTGATVVQFLVGSTEPVLDILGRERTFSGRTGLWDAVLEMIWQRPLLGYGYGGFWLGWEGDSAYIWQLPYTGGRILHAHNGLLNIWLDLGLLGVSVFVVGFLLVFLRAVTWARLSNTAEGLWPLVFLTFILLYNITESAVLTYNDISWVLYVAVALSTFDRVRRVRKTKHTGAVIGRRTGAKMARFSQ